MTYRKLEPSEFSPAIDVLVETFLHHDLAVTGLKGDPEDIAIIRANYTSTLTAVQRNGFVATNAERTSIAVWAAAPGLSSLEWRWADGADIRRACRAKWGWTWPWRVPRPLIQPRYMPREAHWFLLYLATIPDRRNAGLGRQLMEATLREIDEPGCPAYLTTQDPRNIEFYERLGFLIRDQFPAQKHLPQSWGMWREGRSL